MGYRNLRYKSSRTSMWIVNWEIYTLFRSACRTLLNICDGSSFEKGWWLARLFLRKISTVNIWQGPKYAFVNSSIWEIFCWKLIVRNRDVATEFHLGGYIKNFGPIEILVMPVLFFFFYHKSTKMFIWGIHQGLKN